MTITFITIIIAIIVIMNDTKTSLTFQDFIVDYELFLVDFDCVRV